MGLRKENTQFKELIANPTHIEHEAKNVRNVDEVVEHIQPEGEERKVAQVAVSSSKRGENLKEIQLD